MKAAILAGGLGERISDIYPDTIKSLIEFNNKPFIQYQLELLKRNNFKEVVICVGHGADKLINYFNNNTFDDMVIKLVNDGDALLGTGGAIKHAIPFLNSNFMVIYGDSYLDFSYKNAVHKFLLSGKSGLMTIYHNEDKYDKSNIRYSRDRIVSYNKINPDKRYKYIDYGANFFTASCFSNTPDIFDLSYLQRELIDRKMMACDVVTDRFYEIGSKKGIEEFKQIVRRIYVRS